MSNLDQFWHPVAESKEVTKRPYKVEICQVELVLFRQSDGTVAALSNRCPHRQAQLSCGKVRGDKIHCPYHGWNFDGEGNGYLPKNSRKEIHTTSFKVQEYLGVVWVTSQDNEQELENIDPKGLRLVSRKKLIYGAPLEICLDNLLDQEHTNFVHKIFTFTEDDPTIEPEFRVLNDDRSISVTQQGRRQSLGRTLLKLIGINWGKYSHDSQHVTFTPPTAVVDLKGTEDFQGDLLPFFVRVVQIFVPKNEKETIGFSFFFASKRILWPFRVMLGFIIRFELRMDKIVMESIGENGVDLKNARLGKFDKGITRGRRLFLKLYQGKVQGEVKGQLPEG